MNQRFLIKMIRAKALEYEALKELMPEGMKSTLEKTEKELAEWFGIAYGTPADKSGKGRAAHPAQRTAKQKQGRKKRGRIPGKWI